MKTEIQIKPEKNEVYLKDYKAETSLRLVLNTQEEIIFSIDIYSFQPQNHPENHLGWWHFKIKNGEHLLNLKFDLTRIDKNSLAVSQGGKEVPSRNFWVNPDYRLTPLQECKFVFWNRKDEIVSLKRMLIKTDEKKVLDAFYKKHYAADGYSPEAPFLDLLHRHKLKILKKYFQKYFKGRVLDIGCGLSLFTGINKTWKFKIFAGDLVFERMKERKKENPDISWIVFDASFLPFKETSFDSLFAGEIIEHLPDPESALREWNRVHQTGGTLIITTPNKERRINRINRQNWPFSPDHLREFSYKELNHFILPAGGYKPLKKKGIYLELLAKSNKWWQEDYLQREGNKRSNKWLMKLLFYLGYFFPRSSLDLVTVSKKSASLEINSETSK